MFETWQLVAMEEAGYMNTSEGYIYQVAHYLADNVGDVIDYAELRNACIACNVDPDSFSKSDLVMLQKILNEIT